MAGDNEAASTLEATPTWAVATVVFVLIVVSTIIEYLLHLSHKVRTVIYPYLCACVYLGVEFEVTNFIYICILTCID